ncbi:MAG: hypothetical protein V1844_24750 [Pseudomonadota bacterium]
MKIDIPDDSPFFVNTPDSVAVPLADIAAREIPDPERVKRAHQLMRNAKEGKGEKRKPIEVMMLENGKYRVIDGNSTLQALRELDETTAIVRIKNRC